MTHSPPHRVVIAGGGVAGLEALLALADLAGDRVATTLVAPDDHFLVRALSVQDPFALPAAHSYAIESICSAHEARRLRDRVAAVDARARVVATSGGEQVPYESLLVAVGARPVPAYPRVATFRGMQDSEAMHGLIQDIEGGFTSSVAFVVPPGVTWPLPIYELALLAAERASGLGLHPDIALITPEPAPLAIFGDAASAEVSTALQAAGVTLVRRTRVATIQAGRLTAEDGELIAEVDRVMTLPRLEGPRLAGLPCDDSGFLPVDDHCAVSGVRSVFGAGDGTTVPIKQGGIAAQQADAAARMIADRAGAFVVPEPFRPLLRARLLTGSGSKYLRWAGAGGDRPGSTASDHTLWWPPSKVAAPYLGAYLDAVDAGVPPGHHRAPGAIHAQGDPAGGVDLLG
jgi:sulfide:quinone oxidoreductase